VSWKEEFWRESSRTKYLNILGIFFKFFCLGAEIFELKVQRAIVCKTHFPHCIYIISFDITKCYEKKSFVEEHQVHCISTSWAFFLNYIVYELKYLSSKCKELLSEVPFPPLFFYTFLWHNQASWKEEFCRGSSSTLHLNILGIFLKFFCLWAEIFKLKVQRAIVWSPIPPIVF